jgi:hypothetical protein
VVVESELARANGADIWIPNLFNVLALLIAVGTATHQRTARRASAICRLINCEKAAS